MDEAILTWPRVQQRVFHRASDWLSLSVARAGMPITLGL